MRVGNEKLDIIENLNKMVGECAEVDRVTLFLC